MIYKLHEISGQRVLACCDAALMGKSIKKGKVEMKVSEHFYKGEKIKEEELKKILKEADSVNLIGKKCVNVALKIGLINNSDIILIGKIPHIQIYKI